MAVCAPIKDGVAGNLAGEILILIRQSHTQTLDALQIFGMMLKRLWLSEALNDAKADLGHRWMLTLVPHALTHIQSNWFHTH